jgi:hypothetical protein
LLAFFGLLCAGLLELMWFFPFSSFMCCFFMQLGLFSLLPLLGPLVALFNQVVQLVAAGLFPTTGLLLLSAIIQVDFSPHG